MKIDKCPHCGAPAKFDHETGLNYIAPADKLSQLVEWIEGERLPTEQLLFDKFHFSEDANRINELNQILAKAKSLQGG